MDDALYRSGFSNAIEASENKMAPEILMPWRLIDCVITNGIATLPGLAAKFNLFNRAMSIRLGIPDSVFGKNNE